MHAGNGPRLDFVEKGRVGDTTTSQIGLLEFPPQIQVTLSQYQLSLDQIL